MFRFYTKLKRQRLTRIWDRYFPFWKSTPYVSFRSRFSNKPLSYKQLKRR